MAIISGDNLDNVLNGTDDPDTITGLGGADFIQGNRGDDDIDGGDGNDQIVWSPGDGDDTVDGGDGFDTQRFNLLDGPGVAVSIDNAVSGATVSAAFSVAIENIERVTVNSLDGDDSVTINATTASGVLGVNFAGGRGQDVATSNSDVRLFADGGEGDDALTGGSENDVLRGGEAQDTLNGGDGNDQLFGGNGDDDISGGNGADRGFGGEGQDELNGDGGADTLFGDNGDDVLNGGTGNDILVGGLHQDTLIGGAGNDRLLGQQGDDTLTGDAGRDAFVFTVNSGHDKVTDFEDGIDILRFNGTGLAFGDLAFQTLGADLLIKIPSLNGDDITLLGHGATTLDASDFLFA